MLVEEEGLGGNGSPEPSVAMESFAICPTPGKGAG